MGPRLSLRVSCRTRALRAIDQPDACAFESQLREWSAIRVEHGLILEDQMADLQCSSTGTSIDRTVDDQDRRRSPLPIVTYSKRVYGPCPAPKRASPRAAVSASFLEHHPRDVERLLRPTPGDREISPAIDSGSTWSRCSGRHPRARRTRSPSASGRSVCLPRSVAVASSIWARIPRRKPFSGTTQPALQSDQSSIAAAEAKLELRPANLDAEEAEGASMGLSTCFRGFKLALGNGCTLLGQVCQSRIDQGMITVIEAR